MKLSDHSAMVFAAGLGTRMRPLTEHCPKPLIQVGGRSFLERALEHVSLAGLENVVVNSFYYSDLITQALSVHPSVEISHEEERLETGGGAKKALALLGDEAFFTLNGDVIWQTPNLLAQLHGAWHDRKMDALLLLVPMEQAYGDVGSGDFIFNSGGHIERFQGQAARAYMYTGCQMIHPRLFENTPDIFSMNLLFDKAIENKRLKGHILQGEWFHLSTAKELETWEPYIINQEKERVVGGGRL